MRRLIGYDNENINHTTTTIVTFFFCSMNNSSQHIDIDHKCWSKESGIKKLNIYRKENGWMNELQWHSTLMWVEVSFICLFDVAHSFGE